MLLDTASLYFRAYFGVPESVKSPDGAPVNAVRGLLDFITRLVQDHHPEQLVACMDADWRPQWRVDLIPTYKTHRLAPEQPAGVEGTEEIPDTLSPQVPIIEQVLDALGIARVGVPGYEADDVIGTLATRAGGPVRIVTGDRETADYQPARVLIVTGDRDLFQLVDDARGVQVIYPIKGVGNAQIIDEAALREKYGVTGTEYADMAALRGDPSDGLPGVKGIGEKTAAQLIREYGDLAGIRAAAADPLSKLTPARRKNILEGAAYLDVAPTVVRVATDIALPDFDPALPREPLDPMTLEDLAERWGLGTSLTRLLDTLAATR
ncbi:flap endonuclease [Kitasatospora sp. NBC_01287]|uniref:5'-3' exonuclease n=1 Tax=Kitasatospora sp. NBC_01287 TaxID=2903573 RepID=UPI0022526581|nr:5'-3' exonuclease H3TH domain-containing protein [Kitasatospora sp. NBC_01287]MCX4750210.1 flap endonuclease [Kitasatospora sp. NBC_01287]